MGPGNRPAVRVLTAGSAWLGLRPGRKPNALCVGSVVTQTGHQPTVFWFVQLWLQLTLWALVIS